MKKFLDYHCNESNLLKGFLMKVTPIGKCKCIRGMLLLEWCTLCALILSNVFDRVPYRYYTIEKCPDESLAVLHIHLC